MRSREGIHDSQSAVDDLLMLPDLSSKSSALSALRASEDSRYRRTLVSKKQSVALMRLQPIEPEIGRQAAPVFP